MTDDTPETTPQTAPQGGDRIAKVMARAGVASRRDAERMIMEGRVSVNGQKVESPALDVTPADKIRVDGKPLDEPQETKLWLYYKPLGLVTTESDEKGRQTVFDALPRDLPRVMTVGRLDLNSEGLLLLTNDGELKRRLELPTTGWLRRYRVRVNGTPNDLTFAPLRRGVTIEGEEFAPMEINLDSQQGANAWLTVGIREGKNREIRRAMSHVGLIVNRLIRIGYGPFKLTGLEANEVREVKRKVLRDQLGGLLTGDTDEKPRDFRERGAGRRDDDRRDDGRGDQRPRPPRPMREDGDRKPYARREDGDRKPFARREDGERKPFQRREDGDRKPYARREDGEKRPFGKPGDKPFARREDGDRKPFQRREDGERKPYARREDGEGKPYARREDGDRKPYARREDGEKRPFGEKRGFGKPGDKPFARREDGDRKPYARREDGEKRPFGEKRGFGKPGDKPFARREDGDRKPFQRREDGENRSSGEKRGFGKPGDKPFARRDSAEKPFGKREDGDRKGFAGRDGFKSSPKAGAGGKPGPRPGAKPFGKPGGKPGGAPRGPRRG